MNKPFLATSIFVVLLTLYSCLVMFGCVQNDTDLRIGALLALTGNAANYGISLRQGIDMAVDDINSNGGINGKKIKIIYEDSQGDATTGLSGFRKLATINKVSVVIGSISSVVLATAPVADEEEVIFVNSSAISPKICDKAGGYLFSVMVSGAQEAEFMAFDFVKKHGKQPIAVLYSNNSSGVDTKEAFVQELANAGGNLVLSQGYELGSTDFRTELAKIYESGARAIYLIAFSSNEFATVLRQAKEMGLDIQWYSYSGFETRETLELAVDAAEGVFYTYPDYSSVNERMTDFQDAYQLKHGTWADIYTVTSYDAVWFIAESIKKYGSNVSDLRTGMREDSSFVGISGPLRFEDNQCVIRPLIWKTVKNGLYSPVN